jgi:hypothetical protein
MWVFIYNIIFSTERGKIIWAYFVFISGRSFTIFVSIDQSYVQKITESVYFLKCHKNLSVKFTAFLTMVSQLNAPLPPKKDKE